MKDTAKCNQHKLLDFIYSLPEGKAHVQPEILNTSIGSEFEGVPSQTGVIRNVIQERALNFPELKPTGNGREIRGDVDVVLTM